jgi:hypothetical protein
MADNETLPVVADDDFNGSLLDFTKPKKKTGKDGKDKYNSYAMYDGEMYLFETPIGKAPFGPNDYQGNNDFSMTVNIENKQYKKELRTCRQTLIDKNIEYSKIFLGKEQKSRAVVEDLLEDSFMKENKTTKAGDPVEDSITIKIRCDKNKKTDEDGNEYDECVPLCDVYLEDGTEVKFKDINDLKAKIPGGSRVKVIYAMRLWFMQKKMGISFDAVSILVIPRLMKSRKVGFSFKINKKELEKEKKAIEKEQEKEKTEENEENNETSDQESVADSDAGSEDLQDDSASESGDKSEEDAGDVSEEEREPTPPPKPAKKVASTKKKSSSKK